MRLGFSHQPDTLGAAGLTTDKTHGRLLDVLGRWGLRDARRGLAQARTPRRRQRREGLGRNPRPRGNRRRLGPADRLDGVRADAPTVRSDGTRAPAAAPGPMDPPTLVGLAPPNGDDLGRGCPLGQVKWSRLFGQFEGFAKVYPGCEVTPSSSRLIIAKMTMRCGSVGISRPRRRHGRQRPPARFPTACGRPPRRPSDAARRRPGVHRPGTSTARRGDAVTASAADRQRYHLLAEDDACRDRPRPCCSDAHAARSSP